MVIIELIFAICIGIIMGIVIQKQVDSRKLEDEKNNSRKWNIYYNGMREWLAFKQVGKNLEKYFLEQDVSHIAIYGMGDVAGTILDELKEGNIHIDYGIDKNPLDVRYDIKVYLPSDDLPDTDMVIVTVGPDYQAIKDLLGKKISVPIVSLWEIIYEV